MNATTAMVTFGDIIPNYTERIPFLHFFQQNNFHLVS